MLMFACEIHDLRHLGLGDFIGIDPAFAHSMLMNMQHDMGRLLTTLLKKLLQHQYDEFHRGVVVVQQQHAIESRPLGFGPRFGDDARPGVVIFEVRWTNRIAHAARNVLGPMVPETRRILPRNWLWRNPPPIKSAVNCQATSLREGRAGERGSSLM